MYKKNIQRLTKTFLTLSLSDVASRVQLSGPAQAETYILNMVHSNYYFNYITQLNSYWKDVFASVSVFIIIFFLIQVLYNQNIV